MRYRRTRPPSRKHTNIIADLVREARKEADLKDQQFYDQLTLGGEDESQRPDRGSE